MPPPGDGTYLNRSTTGMRYLRICSGPQRGKYVHQLVAEAMLGRPLRDDEQVDHADTNTLNNDWRNLEVKTVSAHAKTTRTRATERRIAARVRDGEQALREDRADRLMAEAEVRDAADGPGD